VAKGLIHGRMTLTEILPLSLCLNALYKFGQLILGKFLKSVPPEFIF